MTTALLGDISVYIPYPLLSAQTGDNRAISVPDDHRLGDPVLTVAMDHVKRFYKKTFDKNRKAAAPDSTSLK